MPGSQITNRQVEIYMNARNQGKTQVTASAKAGISERRGRDIEQGKRDNPKKKIRYWRTRKDPLSEVWQQDLVPLLEATPRLQPITLLEHLQEKYSVQTYPDSILRTLQRRIQHWRVTEGPKKEVMFMQRHEVGRQGLSDFTKLNQATITIAGQPYEHLLYHFRLAFSHWSSIKVIEGGESFTALAEGLQEALQRLGGAPVEHRTDSLSAAYKNLRKTDADDITQRYESLCKHYSMTASRNNPGVSHENGSVESAHGHLKRRIIQALLLRGSNDFPSKEAYQAFIDEVVLQHNRRNAQAISIEKEALQPLPSHKGVDYTELTAVVSCASTIDVRRVLYTVPSRLIGTTLNIHLYHDRLECFYGRDHIVQLARLHPKGYQRAHQVDYRHVIHSLVKKPQAFRYSQIRDDLLPTFGYRIIWRYLDKTCPAKEACKIMVGLLHLAATEDCEQALAEIVLEIIDDHLPVVLSELQEQCRKTPIPRPTEIEVKQHMLSTYNHFIPKYQEVRHA